MGAKNINITPVHVIKDNLGYWNPGTPALRQIQCDSKLVGYEDLFIGIEGDNCATYELGEKAPAPSANTIATAKLRQQTGGYIWIAKADYNTMIGDCNACCN